MDPSNSTSNIPCNNVASNEVNSCIKTKKEKKRVLNQKRTMNYQKLMTLQTLANTHLQMAESHTHMATGTPELARITYSVGTLSPANPLMTRTEIAGCTAEINLREETTGRGIKRNLFSTRNQVDRASMVLIPGMASDEEILRIDAAERGVQYQPQGVERVEEQETATDLATPVSERCWCKKGWCSTYACGCYRKHRACTSKCRNCVSCDIGCRNLSKDLPSSWRSPKRTQAMGSSPSCSPSPSTKESTPTKYKSTSSCTTTPCSNLTPASPSVSTATTSSVMNSNTIPAELDLASPTPTTSTTTSTTFDIPTRLVTSPNPASPTQTSLTPIPSSPTTFATPKESNPFSMDKVLLDPTPTSSTTQFQANPSPLITPNTSIEPSSSNTLILRRGPTIVKIHLESEVASFKTTKLDAAGLVALLQLYFGVSKFVLKDLHGIIEPICDHMDGEFYLIKR